MTFFIIVLLFAFIIATCIVISNNRNPSKVLRDIEREEERRQQRIQKKKGVKESQRNKDNSKSDEFLEEYQNLKFDEKGWLTYPDGIKLKSDEDGVLFSDEIIEVLGYKPYELYESSHCLDGRLYYEGIKGEDYSVTCYWELFSNKLVCIVRKDKHIMNRKEINDFIRLQKQYIKEMSELSGMSLEAIFSIGQGIEEHAIRQSFIETIFKQKSENGSLSVGKFEFVFKDNYLSDFYYDGYNLLVCSLFNSDMVDGYNLIAKHFGGVYGSRIKELINKQAECYKKIDKDILHSTPIMNMFSYANDKPCVNYIALAAIYQQCDVSQEDFLDSTFGHYVLISKTNNNGMTITKIRAYNNTISFYNGHSMLEQSFTMEHDTTGQNNSLEHTEGFESTEGFVYVMINPSLEGMVKIGKTTRAPNDRVKELSSATGVPTPFILVFNKKFKDCHYTEKAIHQYLEKNGYRVSDNREFFKMPVTDAINVVQKFYDVENKNEADTESNSNVIET